ncbi:TatD DNase family protein [Clostridium cavendishii DSM 21758]|uniref:TatD DNase family protein n=1 Tax=Clostridium cavendishii DSM 21758 TaxID=1121302 RepID=A0A1M6PE02_9CLOT|nr:TatD family hydrolase [Clostridium cavendishii]SHK06141.1 TatD DNase family protein [Clostridium cavendishii DSM 21758]
MYKIFDTHAHYDDEAFDEDREELLKDLKVSGVCGILNCGSSLEGARTSFKLANEKEFIYAAVGIHPEQANELTDSVLEEIKEMAKNEKVKAIGEIGLDYYWDENPPKEVQIEVFRKQMSLAKDLKLPVVIHDRDAHADTLTILKEFPEVTGVIHCFSGSLEFAKECIKLGYYIGFTGVVTFKNAKKLVEVAKNIPLERMLVETDCPYMAPEPNRGKRNQSSNIEYIINKLAEIRNMTGEEINNQFLKNAEKFLSINIK